MYTQPHTHKYTHGDRHREKQREIDRQTNKVCVRERDRKRGKYNSEMIRSYSIFSS